MGVHGLWTFLGSNFVSVSNEVNVTKRARRSKARVPIVVDGSALLHYLTRDCRPPVASWPVVSLRMLDARFREFACAAAAARVV